MFSTSPRSRSPLSAVRLLSTLALLGAVGLLAFQLVRYSRFRALLPPGTTMGGVPVGGLTRQQAAERLTEVFNQPIELRYGDAVIHVSPAVVGFELDMDTMLAAVEQARGRTGFWRGFWDFLWGRWPPPPKVPLVAHYSESRLRSYLESEIAARYDQPPLPPQPVVGTVNFKPGQPGLTLDIDSAVPMIERALFSPTERTVDLPLRRVPPPHPSFQNLRVLLQQTAKVEGFDGVMGLYLLDLQTGEEIYFVTDHGKEVPIPPDVSFTAASTIKIPIMVSVFRRIDGTKPPGEEARWLKEMIDKSGNDPADWLMENVISRERGPLEVTKDMRTLGLENTFLAGYFYRGAPLLAVFRTPGNQRTDVSTDPDPYNQTTPAEMGMLLADIYQCAENGGGALVAAFPGEITQAECNSMIDLLANNKIGVLLEASVPEGTRVAHKHGWVSGPDGAIHLISDAGIVYTPGGNYILSIYLYRKQVLLWDYGSKLLADLGEAVYNYFNPPQK